ncbi:unnamed protein product [Caenorhabditis bovis]|uniref:Fork-head domain-containing protein n=1 Tax=Caenorhabditis bovis TaxID=2654633 RepID=A0A8S1F9M0_9PELO|nr:unnamed protein product [Caenorhabditis bovis]
MNNGVTAMDELCDGTATSSTSSVGRLGADAFVGCVGSPENFFLGDEICPLPRDRCNTWPMRRPHPDPISQTSPLIHEQIPEEDPDLFGSNEQCGQLGGTSNGSTNMLHSPDGNHMSSPLNHNNISPTADGSPESGSKKATTRRNAWGNLSYADLITQAIMQSPEKRLTLAQVYEWMVQNVPYFRDKGDSNSSAGWKNMEMEKRVVTTTAAAATGPPAAGDTTRTSH